MGAVGGEENTVVVEVEVASRDNETADTELVVEGDDRLEPDRKTCLYQSSSRQSFTSLCK